MNTVSRSDQAENLKSYDGAGLWCGLGSSQPIVLAAPGALGFGEPKLCVQVKSGDTPLDRPTLDQLVGTMQNVQAKQGLLVSWGGFKTSVEKETANQFFRVRLWDQDDLIDQILEHYDKLSPDIRVELPLKRLWAVALSED